MAQINNDRPLTRQRLNDLLQYDADDGLFFWRVTGSPKAPKGTVAGAIRSGGYRVIAIDGVQYRASRLAWFIVHGEWPEQLLDHKNGDKADDRIENLRLASCAQNSWNMGITSRNTSGFKGVSFSKSEGKWQACISHFNCPTHLGYFDTPESAFAEYCRAANRLRGEFARVA